MTTEKPRSRLLWYLRLIYEFARVSLKSQLEYRINFFAGFFAESAYLCIKLTYLIVIINAGAEVGGLTPDMVKIFVGTYIFMTGIWMLFEGFRSLPSRVFNGGLDLMMVKPCSLHFLQIMGSFNFAVALPNCVCGLAVIVWGWRSVGLPLDWPTLGGFLFFMFFGMFITYSFCLIPALLSFWMSSYGGVGVFFGAFWDYNNMPMTIYPKIVRDIGTFVIPVFVLTNWAGLFVLGRLSVFEIAWGITAPVILFIIALMMWKFGLRRYTSANG